MASPKLKIIDGSAPPRPLGKHGMALWRSITSEYDITDAAGRELLCLACQALDRAEAIAEYIDHCGEGAVTEQGVVKANPMLRDELSCRAFVSKCLERLGLNSEAPKLNGRPGLWSHHGPQAKIESA